MKILILFLIIVFSQQILAQQAFEISKTGSNKVTLFEENKRVKVKTAEGKKHIGRFQIIDGQNIEIEGSIIPLSSITNIKSRSIVAGIAGTALIVYGALVTGVGYISGSIYDTPSAIYATAVIGSIIATSGILFNEFAKNHKNNKWSYKIINP